MVPGGGFGVVKPINVDPEDVGLHDTDNSELSASIPMSKKLKMKKKKEEGQLEKRKEKQERRRRRSSG